MICIHPRIPLLLASTLTLLLCLSGCGVLPKNVSHEQLPPESAYIRQYKQGSSVVSLSRVMMSLTTQAHFETVKLDGEIYFVVPVKAQALTLVLLNPPPLMFTHPHGILLTLPVKLEAGKYYEIERYTDSPFNLVMIRGKDSRQPASRIMVFNINDLKNNRYEGPDVIPYVAPHL